MAILLDKNVAAQSGNGSSVTTAAVDTSASTLLVVVSVSDDSGGAPTISDSKTNTWVSAIAIGNGGIGPRVTISYVKNPTVGTGHTFSASGSSPGIFVATFSGTDTTANVDQTNSAAGSGTTNQPGSVTPSANGEVLVTGMSESSAGVLSIDSGYTTTDVASVTANSRGGGLAYLIQTTAAASNPTWTDTIPQSLPVAAITTYKAAAAAGITYPQLERDRRGIGRGILIGV